MLISEKQHEANQRNAENSTGPKTPEGKQAVKFNALKYGLHARSTILPYEDLAEFDELGKAFTKSGSPPPVPKTIISTRCSPLTGCWPAWPAESAAFTPRRS